MNLLSLSPNSLLFLVLCNDSTQIQTWIYCHSSPAPSSFWSFIAPGTHVKHPHARPFLVLHGAMYFILLTLTLNLFLQPGKTLPDSAAYSDSDMNMLSLTQSKVHKNSFVATQELVLCSENWKTLGNISCRKTGCCILILELKSVCHLPNGAWNQQLGNWGP
jgi:hypothetical protein